jgi:hypothetical protein
MFKKINLGVMIFIMAAVGVSSADSWELAEGRQHSLAGKYEVMCPAGWVMFKKGPRLVLTKHGTSIEVINIDRQSVSEPLSLTRRMLKPGMLPHQIADIIVSELSLSPGISQVALTVLAPATIDSIDGVRLEVSYTSAPAITHKAIIYAFICGEWYYEIIFSAAARCCYEPNMEIFMDVVNSFKLFNSAKREAMKVSMRQ